MRDVIENYDEEEGRKEKEGGRRNEEGGRRRRRRIDERTRGRGRTKKTKTKTKTKRRRTAERKRRCAPGAAMSGQSCPHGPTSARQLPFCAAGWAKEMACGLVRQG